MARYNGFHDREPREKKQKSILERKNQSRYHQEGTTPDYFRLMLSSLGNDGFGKLIQGKLDVGQSGDHYEQQADKIAEQIMNQYSSEPVDVQMQADRVQAGGSAGLRLSGETETGIKSLSGKGSALSRPLRNFFEPHFGDLSAVKIHTGRQANRLNESIGAKAFTYGKDVAFRSGEFQPGTKDGKKLIAHELTHVVQQTGGVQKKDVVQRDVIIGRYPRLKIHTPCFLRDPNRSYDILISRGEQIFLDEDQWVSMCGNFNDWIEVEYAYRYSDGYIDLIHGWIYRDWTSLKRNSDPEDERRDIFDELCLFLDKVMLVFNKWKVAIIDQGIAYREAYEIFKGVIDDANKDVEFRNEVFAAILTTALGGGLGWIGEAASKKINLSHKFLGTLEDMMQTAIGETIDINQNRLHNSYVAGSVNPETYIDELEKQMIRLGGDLQQYIIDIKTEVLHSEAVPDLLHMLNSLHSWWNQTAISQMPNICNYDEDSEVRQNLLEKYKKETEVGFWKYYILDEAVTEGIMGFNLLYIETPIRRRFETLDSEGVTIKEMAGVTKWSGFIMLFPDAGVDAVVEDPYTDKLVKTNGREDALLLRQWAAGYDIKPTDL